jgi:ABC-type multidrug transport system fused ATPase/permease subunit
MRQCHHGSPSQYNQMRHYINILAGMFFVLISCELVTYFFLHFLLDRHNEKLVFQMRSHVSRHLRMDTLYLDNEKHFSSALIASIAKDGQSIEGFNGAILGQILNCSTIIVAGTIMTIVIN